MIVAFSTSSPLASVALLDSEGRLAGYSEEDAPMRASEACMRGLERILSELGLTLRQVNGYLADLGPGSFTGVRVGVTLAKVLAWTHGCRVGGLSSFDLINPAGTAAVPSRRNEWWVRRSEGESERTAEVPSGAVGYGFPGGDRPPSAARFAEVLALVDWVEPMRLVPAYLAEPSISTPKVAYRDGPFHG